MSAAHHSTSHSAAAVTDRSASPGTGKDAAADASGASTKKLTKEDEERLVDSLFRQAIEKKKKSLETIETSVYKYDPPKVIAKEQAEASAKRQCTEEIERRKKKHEELLARHHPASEKKTLAQDDLQASLQRIYDDAIRVKKERLATLQKSQTEREKSKVVGNGQLTKEQQQAMAERLSKPPKRQFTDEEINSLTVYV